MRTMAFGVYPWLIRNNLLFEHAAGDFLFRPAVRSIGDVAGLDKFVHDAPLGNGEFKKGGLVQGGGGDQLVIPYFKAVDGIVFAQGTAVNPAVGKTK